MATFVQCSPTIERITESICDEFMWIRLARI
jgi:hypothetical protein